MNCAIKSGWQKVGKCNSFRENGSAVEVILRMSWPTQDLVRVSAGTAWTLSLLHNVNITHLTNREFVRVELMKPQVINQFADALESEAFRAEGFAHRIGQKLIWMAGTKPLLVGNDASPKPRTR